MLLKINNSELGTSIAEILSMINYENNKLVINKINTDI